MFYLKSEPGITYWIKLLLCRICIRIYRLFKVNRLDFYDLNAVGEPERVGFLTHPNEIEMEKPKTDTHLAKAEDKLFCYGVNSKSECLVVSVSRLCNQKAEANIHIRLSNGKSYCLVQTEDFQQSLGDKNVFSCGGLQMSYTNPLRQWRIFFSGYLREDSEDNSEHERMVYVKFSLLWKAASDVYDANADLNDEVMAKSMANSRWTSLLPPLLKLQDCMNFYAQAGVMLGKIFVEDTVDDYELYLFGERIRSLEAISLTKEKQYCHILGYIHEDGTYVHFGETSLENIAQKLHFGFVMQPDGALKKINGIDMPLLEIIGGEEIKGTADAGSCYIYCGCDTESIYKMNSRGHNLAVGKVLFHLNGKRGTGIRIAGKFTSLSNPSNVSTPQASEPAYLPEALFPMVVNFTEETCQLSEVTGGKGSSLGKLTDISEELQNFYVPRGIVVTTASYKSFVTQEILGEINKLESVLYGNSKGDVKEACDRVKDEILKTNLPKNVSESITRNLKNSFGDKFLLMKFAIRSSATGEDTEQMSAAGQMDTFLGVSGLNNILLAVKKCWASQFGTIAVQYKKRYGQILNSPMAVVIQEMVPCEVAGVMFTCDPLTGNPTTVTITANFGLGESVVSGLEEPDTIEFSRDPYDIIKLRKISIGAKSRKIVLKGEGTDTEEVLEEEKRQCCLSEEDSLSLGRLGIEIEKRYHSRRDIEWGMLDGKIYMFQSRPVTSGSQETDYEIEHELDGILRIENDYFSTCNFGEVLPGSLRPLSSDLFLKTISIPWQKSKEMEWQTGARTQYFRMGWTTMLNHAMFNVADIMRSDGEGNLDMNAQSTMVAIFGRIIDEKEILSISGNRYKTQRKENSWIAMYRMYKNLFFSHWRLRKCLKMLKNYRIPVEKYNESKDLFDAISRSYCDFEETMFTHMACSQGSTTWNMKIIYLLSKLKKNIDDDVYSDLSSLLTTSSDVESADVPSAIQNLGFYIGKSITPSDFKSMNPRVALNWLETTPTLAGKKFKEFLTRHGHRCFKELDIYYTPWASDPLPLVELLQNLVGNVKQENKQKGNTVLNLWKSINNLKVPLGILDKLKLLFIVPLSRNAVQEREMSKSLFVKNMDAWRKAYWVLAKRMVSEGYIPDEKILFFMTLEDIKNLLDTRSPKILSKAYHRQRLHPKMEKYIFPELMKGLPKPINDEDFAIPSSEENFSMKGIPVSQGVCKGFVRVAMTVEEAASLKPGEILIAYSTDIGWSPFFPMLAGVATELGGLISHGAVVSREYGLPCVAGLRGATRQFKTGDYAMLDGTKGIIQKIQSPANSE